MHTPDNDAPQSAPKQVKPLPPGYLWRVSVMVSLLLGASMCFLFVNSILGGILMLCGLAFGKFSNLHELEKDVTTANARDSQVESALENARK